MNNAAMEYGMENKTNSDKLFNDHIKLVKSIAQHISFRLPPSQSLDDLIQVGLIGLMEASRVYDPALGASFKSYATIRVKGSIMDELRRQSWVPRSVQQKSRKLSQAINAVEKREGRAATDREIASELNESMSEYAETLETVASCNLFSLDDDNNFLEPETVVDTLFDDLHDEGMKNRLAEVIKVLPKQEQMVISLYYDAELNLREIGDVLDVSESRVCQIHSQAISRIRGRLLPTVEEEFSF